MRALELWSLTGARRPVASGASEALSAQREIFALPLEVDRISTRTGVIRDRYRRRPDGSFMSAPLRADSFIKG